MVWGRCLVIGCFVIKDFWKLWDVLLGRASLLPHPALAYTYNADSATRPIAKGSMKLCNMYLGLKGGTVSLLWGSCICTTMILGPFGKRSYIVPLPCKGRLATLIPFNCQSLQGSSIFVCLHFQATYNTDGYTQQLYADSQY